MVLLNVVELSRTNEAGLLGFIGGLEQGAALNAGLFDQAVEGLVVVDEDGLLDREEPIRRPAVHVIPPGLWYHLNLSLAVVALPEDLLEDLFDWGG